MDFAADLRYNYFILHNVRIYRTAMVKRIWLALWSQVTWKF